jgi:Ca2+-binding RTX toxin-like protein
MNPSSSVRARRHVPRLEALEARNAPACFTFFFPTEGVLVVWCDGADDTAALTTGDGGALLLNGEPIPDGPTLDNTQELFVFGGGGNDLLSLDGLTGPTIRGRLFGDGGSDSLQGGGGGDWIVGGDGDDRLGGGAGDDFLEAGAGDDHLYGDDGQDWMYGEDGNDELVGGMDEATDFYGGGAGCDLFQRDYPCSVPEDSVMDREPCDFDAVVVFIVDPCGPWS